MSDNTDRPPNLILAGDALILPDEYSTPETVKYALVIQCSNPDQVRDAMRTGKVEFTIFEHYDR